MSLLFSSRLIFTRGASLSPALFSSSSSSSSLYNTRQTPQQKSLSSLSSPSSLSFLRWSSTVPRQTHVPDLPPLRMRDGVRYFSRDEVSRHDSREDCWVIIHKSVYNVTSWLERHPGGDIILETAGQDATILFEDRSHTDYAYELLKDFYIGKVEETARYVAEDDLDSSFR